MSKGELIKAADTAVAQAPTGFSVGRGFERVDMEAISMPRVKIMQPGSPELQDEDYSFKQGQLVHSLLMEQVAEKFIPLSIWPSQVLLVPRDEAKKKEMFDALNITDAPGFIICRALDAKQGTTYGDCARCPLKAWRKMADGSEKPPLCTATVNVLSLFDGQQMPVVLQFASTSFKHGKKFRDMALFSGGDLFSRKYKVSVIKKSDSKGTWYEVAAKPGGVASPEELAVAEAMYHSYGTAVIETDVDEVADVPVEGNLEF